MLFVAFFLVILLAFDALDTLTALATLAVLAALLAVRAVHTLLPLDTLYARRCVLALGGRGARGSGPQRGKLS